MCDQKITVIFEFRELHIFDFHIFFCYGTLACCIPTYVDNISHLKILIKCARTFEMLTVVFGESTMSRTQVQLFYNRFREGLEDVNDDTHPGRPSTLTTYENIEAVKKMILDNRRITIREVADAVYIAFGSCQAIFADILGMKRAAPKFVPKLLNFARFLLVFSQNKTVIMPQPPYSPDLAPANFFCSQN